jgi:glycosidase
MRIDDLLKLYDWEIQLAQLNLLDSHDTPRMLTTVGEDKSSFLLATLLMMTFPGAPSIFYGDEVGLLGGKDPDCRRVFPEPEYWDVEILKNYKQLIALRHQYSALSTGTYKTLYADQNLYVFARILDRQEVLIAVNAGKDRADSVFDVTELQSQPEKIVYGSGRIDWHVTREGKKIELIIPAKSSIMVV